MRVLFLVMAVALFACGSDEPPIAGDYQEELAAAWCEVAVRCDNPYWVNDMDGCVAHNAEVFCDQLDCSEKMTSSWVEDMEDCIEYITALECRESDLGDSCRRALRL